MTDIVAAFHLAVSLILHMDRSLLDIIGLSLAISLTAVAAAAVLGLPLGAAVALGAFPGRQSVVLLLNSAMGLPPVVVGLLLYLVLSRSGPLGSLGLLFTPTAMVVAQTVLVLPIIAALTRQVVETLWEEYAEQLRSLGCSRRRAVPTLLWDARYSLATVILAGFGRASAEVGAVIIVEALLTAFFLIVILGATDDRAPKGFGPLAIGLSLTLIHLVSIPISNTSVNPARSTGVAFFNGHDAPAQLWVFWLAPLLGGLIGGVIYPLLFEGGKLAAAKTAR